MIAVNTIAVWAQQMSAVTAVAAVGAETSVVALQRSGDFVLDPGRSILGPASSPLHHSLLAPVPDRTFHGVGLLAKAQDGPEVFGVTGLLSKGHPGIEAAIKDRFGEIERFLWGGEFVVKPTEHGPQLTDANETSGYLHNLQQRTPQRGKGTPQVLNNVDDLAVRLRRASPVVLSSGACFLGFASAPLHYHPVIADFTNNFRHALGGKLWLFGQDVINDEILTNHSTDQIHKSLQRQIEAVQYLKAFCELIQEEDPNLIKGLKAFIKQLEKILAGKKLTESQYQSMVSVFADLNHFYVMRLHNNQNNRYDLFVFS